MLAAVVRLIWLIGLAACSANAPAPTPAPTPSNTAPDAGPEPAVTGAIELATYCHEVADRASATWVRVDDYELETPEAGRCYLPWADQPSKVFQPHSDAEGWVDLDLLRIAESECIDGEPSPAQIAGILAPESMWIRVPDNAVGRALAVRARPMLESGWGEWRDVFTGQIEPAQGRVVAVPMSAIVGDRSRPTIELEVTLDALSETVIVHWPTSC